MVWNPFKSISNWYTNRILSSRKPLESNSSLLKRLTGTMYENASWEVQYQNQEWKKRNISKMTKEEYFAFKKVRTAEIKGRLNLEQEKKNQILSNYRENLESQRARIASRRSPLDHVQEELRAKNKRLQGRYAPIEGPDPYVDRLEMGLRSFADNLRTHPFSEVEVPSQDVGEIDLFSAVPEEA